MKNIFLDFSRKNTNRFFKIGLFKNSVTLKLERCIKIMTSHFFKLLEFSKFYFKTFQLFQIPQQLKSCLKLIALTSIFGDKNSCIIYNWMSSSYICTPRAFFNTHHKNALLWIILAKIWHHLRSLTRQTKDFNYFRMINFSVIYLITHMSN